MLYAVEVSPFMGTGDISGSSIGFFELSGLSISTVFEETTFGGKVQYRIESQL